jgi:hypothetical protein
MSKIPKNPAYIQSNDDQKPSVRLSEVTKIAKYSPFQKNQDAFQNLRNKVRKKANIVCISTHNEGQVTTNEHL